MKFSKLAALARREKMMVLASTWRDDLIIRQHLQVGSGIYPLDGMPVMDKDELLVALDVQPDKKHEYTVLEQELSGDAATMAEDNPSEKPDEYAELKLLRLDTGITTRVIVETPWGIRFVNADYVDVLKGEKGVEWFARDMGGGRVALVGKRGYQTIASIGTSDAWIDETNCELLSQAVERMKAVVAESKKRDGEQQRI